jgi:hypothetical protein
LQSNVNGFYFDRHNFSYKLWTDTSELAASVTSLPHLLLKHHPINQQLNRNMKMRQNQISVSDEVKLWQP